MSIHLMTSANVAPVILAGGYGSFSPEGERQIPKVLEEVGGVPMIVRVARIFQECIHVVDPIVVVNTTYGAQIEQAMRDYGFHPRFVYQTKRVGNAGAVSLCLPELASMRYAQARHVAVLYADMPCWRVESVRGLIEAHLTNEVGMSIFLVNLNTPGCPNAVRKYGRVIFDKDGNLVGAFEPRELDATLAAKAHKVNPSAYLFDREWLQTHLSCLEPHNPGDGFPEEYWLPDLVGIAGAQNKLHTIDLADPNEALGVNTRAEHHMVSQWIAVQDNERTTRQALTRWYHRRP